MRLPHNFALALNLPQGCHVEARELTDSPGTEITVTIMITAKATLSHDAMKLGDELGMVRAIRKAGEELTAGLKSAAARLAESQP